MRSQSIMSGGPSLVGLGCEGAAGPLYAAQEDDFPPCRKIERVGQ
jgi:hypothetical protein